MTDDEQLLRHYSRERSELAFGELVARHIDLVYAAALRVVNGDTHLAQDVTQTVFLHLARKARSLPRGVVLAGWLHRHTCYTAATAVRTERRRKTREQIAIEMRALDDHTELPWERIAPYLDECLDQLKPSDRDALVLRFLQRQDFHAVGAALGLSEDSAQKRVSRALEKLRLLLSRRGVGLSAAALASVLAAEAATAAPVGLAVGMAAASLSAAHEVGSGFTLLRLMAETKLKTGIIGAILIGGVVASLLIQQRAEAKLRGLDEALRQQAALLVKGRSENERLSNLLAQARNSTVLPEAQRGELLKLRGEIGRLKTEAKRKGKTAAFREEIAQLPLDQVWPARAKRLKKWLEENPSEKIPEIELLRDRTWLNSIYPNPVETDEECRRAMCTVRANADSPTLNNLGAALRQYAQGSGGQFPADLSQLKPYFDPLVADEVLGRYTILPASSLVGELQPGGDWVITEKAPVNEADDNRTAIGLNDVRTANQQITNRWVTPQ